MNIKLAMTLPNLMCDKLTSYLLKTYECDLLTIFGNDFNNYFTENFNNINNSILNNVIILDIQDIWKIEHHTQNISFIVNLCNSHYDKKIILIGEYFTLSRYSEILTEISNLYYINVSWIAHEVLSNDRNIVNDKTFDKNLIGVSLNNGPRHHRILLISLLYKFGLNKKMIISRKKQTFFKKSKSVLEFSNLEFSNLGDFEEGFQLWRNDREDGFILDKYKNWHVTDSINSENFNLINYVYKSPIIEFIAETVFSNRINTSSIEQTGFLTEKTLQSMYGYTFPIIIGGYKSVEELRKIGFDVFDDIIDHTYDDIKDPITRLYLAVTNNKHLFDDPAKTFNLWKKNKYRFDNNIKLMPNFEKYYYDKNIELISNFLD